MLKVYTIYEKPLDYPDYFVIRIWTKHPKNALPVAGKIIAFGKTLEEIRAQIPSGLKISPRHPLDDPVIVEHWI